MTIQYGLIAEVYRAADGVDCTNSGASSKYKEFTVCRVGEQELDNIFPITDDRPEMVVIYRPEWNDHIAIPAELHKSGRHTMFGGNFLYDSDSRWGRALEANAGKGCAIAIKIHDRVEG